MNEKKLMNDCSKLEGALREFGVVGKVTAIHNGPVVSSYEFEMKAGTRVGKVVQLEEDLSIAMDGRKIRIVPRIAGRAAIGIEIPNESRDSVMLYDMIMSKEYKDNKAALPIVVGASTTGQPVISDLTKMPHLLIAGSTGSGKSVAMNTFIVSMLCKKSSDELKLVLIDPKMIELSCYNNIPHLLTPVVTQANKAVEVLNIMIDEMMSRYELMKASNTRNIASYNESIKGKEGAEALPYIVIVIDEIADLMIGQYGKQMESCIVRLAQMARAAGIHLIIATQRPSTDVVTGLIKANFPSRIALKTASGWDSRVILDSVGAETLLGCGDMLFMEASAGGELVRVHGAYVSDSEIEGVVAGLKA